MKHKQNGSVFSIDKYLTESCVTKEANNPINIIRQKINLIQQKVYFIRKNKQKKGGGSKQNKTKQTPQTNQAVKTLIHQKQVNLTN